MDIITKKLLLNHLSQFLTENRRSLFNKVLSSRTRHLTVVIEDIYQSQNASAVLRTCDLTGVQDIHIIENKNIYDINPDVALGSTKWLNLYKYNESAHNTLAAFEKLRENGYKIIATTPHENDFSLESLPLDEKIAVVFGTELTGLTQVAIDDADAYLRIPMHGFTESYNISVAAALTLFTLTEKLRKSEINWQLSKDDRLNIELEWSHRSLKRSEIIEDEFLKSLKSK